MDWPEEWYYKGKPNEYKSWINKIEEWSNKDEISNDLREKLIQVVKWGRSKSRTALSYENWCELDDVAQMIPKDLKNTSFWLNSFTVDRMAPALYHAAEGVKWLNLLWYCANEYNSGFLQLQ